jgi:hypothetical protein
VSVEVDEPVVFVTAVTFKPSVATFTAGGWAVGVGFPRFTLKLHADNSNDVTVTTNKTFFQDLIFIFPLLSKVLIK